MPIQAIQGLLYRNMVQRPRINRALDAFGNRLNQLLDSFGIQKRYATALTRNKAILLASENIAEINNAREGLLNSGRKRALSAVNHFDSSERKNMVFMQLVSQKADPSTILESSVLSAVNDLDSSEREYLAFGQVLSQKVKPGDLIIIRHDGFYRDGEKILEDPKAIKIFLNDSFDKKEGLRKIRIPFDASAQNIARMFSIYRSSGIKANEYDYCYDEDLQPIVSFSSRKRPYDSDIVTEVLSFSSSLKEFKEAIAIINSACKERDLKLALVSRSSSDIEALRKWGATVKACVSEYENKYGQKGKSGLKATYAAKYLGILYGYEAAIARVLTKLETEEIFKAWHQAIMECLENPASIARYSDNVIDLADSLSLALPPSYQENYILTMFKLLTHEEYSFIQKEKIAQKVIFDKNICSSEDITAFLAALHTAPQNVKYYLALAFLKSGGFGLQIEEIKQILLPECVKLFKEIICNPSIFGSHDLGRADPWLKLLARDHKASFGTSQREEESMRNLSLLDQGNHKLANPSIEQDMYKHQTATPSNPVYRDNIFMEKWVKGKKVLDVGSGYAKFVDEIRQFDGHDPFADPYCRAIGIDLGPPRKNNNFILSMSAFDIVFPDGSFDYVHDCRCLELLVQGESDAFLLKCDPLYHVGRAISEIARVLKKGGLFHVETYDSYYIQEICKEFGLKQIGLTELLGWGLADRIWNHEGLGEYFFIKE